MCIHTLEVTKRWVDHIDIWLCLLRSAKLPPSSRTQQGWTQTSDSIGSAVIGLIDLELGDKLLHGTLLLVHVILEDLDFGLQADVLLTISINLNLQLDGILIELLLFFDVATVGSLYFNFNWVGRLLESCSTARWIKDGYQLVRILSAYVGNSSF